MSGTVVARRLTDRLAGTVYALGTSVPARTLHPCNKLASTPILDAVRLARSLQGAEIGLPKLHPQPYRAQKILEIDSGRKFRLVALRFKISTFEIFNNFQTKSRLHHILQ